MAKDTITNCLTITRGDCTSSDLTNMLSLVYSSTIYHNTSIHTVITHGITRNVVLTGRGIINVIITNGLHTRDAITTVIGHITYIGHITIAMAGVLITTDVALGLPLRFSELNWNLQMNQQIL